MIQLIRIDDRLLHGQVAYSWKAGLGYQAIIIADDEVSKDEFRKSVLKMAVPNGVKLAIKNIEEAAELANNPKLKDVKVFIIVNSPKTAYEIYQKINERPVLNLGGSMNSEGKKEFSKAVYLNDDDVSYLDKLYSEGVEIDVRQTPTEKKQSYDELRKKF